MAWAIVAGAAVSVVGGSLLADDYGAEEANEAVADATDLQAQISKDQWNRYKQIYEPLERQLVSEADRYGSDVDYAKAAGEASATVSQQFGKARERLRRTPGLDPSSAAYQASLVDLELSQAATDAAQQNLARKQVTDTAYAKKQAALAMGKGLDSTASSGLLSSANANLGLAQAATAQANQQAAAIGGVVNRAVNWLGTMGGNNSASAGTSYFDSLPAGFT